MARLPRGFHPQAAKRGGSALAWRPGWRQSGQQPVGRVPIAAYTRRVTQVPLTGGQAQGTMSGASAGPSSGSVTSPFPFDIIATLTFTKPGTFTYTVSWTVTLDGTVSGAEADNFALYKDGVTLLATSVNAAADGSYAQVSFTGTFGQGDQIFLTNPAAGTAGAVYGGTVSAVTATGGAATLQVGPQGMGTTWYPIQVTLTTSTGALDTSTANIYLGPAITPATQVGQVYSGNGTAALAIPSMAPGQTLIVAWSNGHPGDTVSMNVIGNMDALAA